MGARALDDLDSGGLTVMAEQAGLDGDALALLVRSLNPDERHIEAFSLTAEQAAAGDVDDESSVHGSRQQRTDGTAAELVRLAETAANRAAARDGDGTFSERTPLEVFSELHLMLLDTADRPDTAVLCGPAGPPLLVSRAELGSICEPVTPQTFIAHAAALEVRLPVPGGELDARFHTERSQLKEKLVAEGPGAEWRPFHVEVFRASGAVLAGEPGPGDPWRAMWSAMTAAEMEYTVTVAWCRRLGRHPPGVHRRSRPRRHHRPHDALRPTAVAARPLARHDHRPGHVSASLRGHRLRRRDRRAPCRTLAARGDRRSMDGRPTRGPFLNR